MFAAPQHKCLVGFNEKFQIEDAPHTPPKVAPGKKKCRELLAEVVQQIDELQRMKSVLTELSRACEQREPTGDCPILEALNEDA